MKKKKKHIVFKAVFMYILISCGIWMFLNCCSNSYNRFSDDKIAPASVDLSGTTAEVSLLEQKMMFDFSFLSPESSLCCGAYLVAPDEMRSACYLFACRDI